MRLIQSFTMLSLASALAAIGAQAIGAGLTPVPSAQPKIVGNAAPNVLSPELAEQLVAQGATPLENGTALIPFYGYYGDRPSMVPALGGNVEATKSEPDKNTYLV